MLHIERHIKNHIESAAFGGSDYALDTLVGGGGEVVNLIQCKYQEKQQFHCNTFRQSGAEKLDRTYSKCFFKKRPIFDKETCRWRPQSICGRTQVASFRKL